MRREELLEAPALYFPGSFGRSSRFRESEVARDLIDRLLKIPTEPLTLTHLNQFLHLTNEAGVSKGFFGYYFLSAPSTHPYPVDRVFASGPGLNQNVVSSLEQLRWGLHRFFLDGLLYFVDLRTAYQELRRKSYNELEGFFASKRLDSAGMQARGEVLPFHFIPADDRYLISEMACKAYSPIGEGASLLVEDMLLEAYRRQGGGRVRISDLFASESHLAKSDPQAQMMLQFATEEFADDTVNAEDEIRQKITTVGKRFVKAREMALANTGLYLSIVNELDVYVATSMRRRSDFREMGRDCELIFNHDGLRRFRLRYFDPTQSAAEGHEDKGIIECLMVKCAKALVYFAGDTDSFGKDAEVTMALSLGKPVIILCPATHRGEQRMRFFRDVHPLSRMIDMNTGIAVGAMITNDPLVVAQLLERVLDNRMEYDLDQNGDGYFRLRERLTRSVVRLQTNSSMLRESFENYYHGVE